MRQEVVGRERGHVIDMLKAGGRGDEAGAGGGQGGARLPQGQGGMEGEMEGEIGREGWRDRGMEG